MELQFLSSHWGTWLIDNDKAADAVKAAIEIGYRHIDTAQAYMNEAGVGEGIRNSGVARDQLFVTTKVAAEHKDYDSAMAGIDGSLKAMGLDFIDMMIIHSPQPWVKVNQSDDRYVQKIREKLLSSDMVVFATPLYYYGMSAQLKTVVDRFCAYNSSLNSRHLKSALLTVAWNADDWTFEALVAHYKTLVRYINFEDKGMVLGYGCGSPGMTKRSRFLQEAYQLGKTL